MKIRNHSNLSYIIFIALLYLVLTAWNAERFLDNKDGTFTDIYTNLMWTKNVSSQKSNLADATSYAKKFSLGGYKDWRLPTRIELEYIGKASPDSIFNIKSGEYVTSSESQEQSNSIYVIGIYPEKQEVAVYYNGSKQYPFYVWLVRENKNK